MKSALIGIIASLTLAQAANACPTFSSSVSVKTAVVYTTAGQQSISVTIHPRAANTSANLSQIESAMGLIDSRATANTTISGIVGGPITYYGQNGVTISYACPLSGIINQDITVTVSLSGAPGVPVAFYPNSMLMIHGF